MIGEQKPQTVEKNSRIEDVEVIQETGTFITRRQDIKKYVEAPLVEACEMLWDKNVRTIWSSCNPKDFTQGYGVIGIDYESLSEENKKIGEEVGEVDENTLGKTLWLKIPLNTNTTSEEAKAKSIELASKFKKQKAIWIPSYTQDELIKSYLLIRNITDEVRQQNPIESFVTEDNYLDKSINPSRLYDSKELYEKTLEEIK